MRASSQACLQLQLSDAYRRSSSCHVQGELTLNGTIRAEDEVQVVAETQGKVINVSVHLGSPVVKGDALVQIDDELKQASFESAQAAF
jgi:multidrug efflux pump subunit AcrA (membrane-fusion protein)